MCGNCFNRLSVIVQSYSPPPLQSLPSIANLSPNDMACLTPIEIYLDFPPHPKFQTSYLWRSLLLVMLPTCSLIEKRNFTTGIFQGFYLDFKYPFFPEPFWKLSETAFRDIWNIRIKSDTGVRILVLHRSQVLFKENHWLK